LLKTAGADHIKKLSARQKACRMNETYFSFCHNKSGNVVTLLTWRCCAFCGRSPKAHTQAKSVDLIAKTRVRRSNIQVQKSI